MIEHRTTISLPALARLSQVKPTEVKNWITSIEDGAHWPVEIDSARSGCFSYRDALAVEVARQLHDDSGLPMPSALRIVAYTGAVPLFIEHRSRQEHLAKALTDFWIAIAAARNTWGKEPRGSFPVTGFGATEYWSTMHVSGTLNTVMDKVRDAIIMDGVDYPDSDFARVFMTNVSAADRRLRKRAGDLAAELGIRVVGNKFAAG